VCSRFAVETLRPRHSCTANPQQTAKGFLQAPERSSVSSAVLTGFRLRGSGDFLKRLVVTNATRDAGALELMPPLS
jgi:hypothetical protein